MAPFDLSMRFAPPHEPANNFAWADGQWAIYSTYRATSRITKSVAWLTRRVFRSQNGQNCVGIRSSAPNPIVGAHIIPADSRAGLRGKGRGSDKEMRGRGKRESGGNGRERW